MAAIAIAALPVVWSASLGGGVLLLGVVKASIDIFASDSGTDERPSFLFGNNFDYKFSDDEEDSCNNFFNIGSFYSRV